MRLDDDLVPFLESGCALVVGALDPAGEPLAMRAWGLDVLDAAAGRIRVLVLAGELPALGSIVAVTSSSVRTLRSLQMKGPVVDLERASTDADVERVARYTAEFFGDIHDTDRTPLEAIDRIRPVAPLGAFHAVVEQLYDQSPGPGAGAAVG